MARSQIELFLDGQFWHDKPQHLDLGIMEQTLPAETLRYKSQDIISLKFSFLLYYPFEDNSLPVFLFR